MNFELFQKNIYLCVIITYLFYLHHHVEGLLIFLERRTKRAIGFSLLDTINVRG